jgi:hypothetical protein
VALPGLVLLAYLGLPAGRRKRVGQLALAGVAFVAVSLTWLTATLLYPAHDRPYAYGSTNGSAWNAAFVFNGVDRLEGKAVEGPQRGYRPGYPYPKRTQAERDRIPIVPPSPTRLLARVGPLSGERLGLEALAGLLLGGTALAALLWTRLAAHSRRAARGRRPVQPTAGPSVPLHAAGEAHAERKDSARLQLAAAAGLMLWLLTGLVLFSHMVRLHPRYTEAFTPVVAATLGFGVHWATARRTRWRLAALTATLLIVVIYAEHLLFGATAVWWVTAAGAVGALVLAWSGGSRIAVLALALVALLAIPTAGSLRAVHENVSDTNRLGVLAAGELVPLSRYLRANQGTAYYEAAFDSGTKMGELVMRDARPILVLTTLNGRVFTSVARLRALVAAGRVRYAFLSGGCGPHTPRNDPDCSAPARWARAHGSDVSRQAGLPRAGILWRLRAGE